ncbi:MAG: GP88 family protein [Chthoniobacterales bacterium]
MLLTAKALETDRATRIASFETGYSDGSIGAPDHWTGDILTAHRVRVGFQPRTADILTPPDANAKLDKGATPTYGLTLAHATLTEYNACPWAGVCKDNVCVLNNGKGRYSSVRNAWRWRTTFLAEDTAAALYRIGWELGRAVRKHGAILFRPNVNSDVVWHRVIPTLGDLENVTTYGYTKNPAVMVGDGRIGGIRYAYSVNENSRLDRVREFVTNGGAAAVLTNRAPHAPINPDRVRGALWLPDAVAVLDADATDEWMLRDNVIGDLSAKGRARDLIGRNDFVRCCY